MNRFQQERNDKIVKDTKELVAQGYHKEFNEVITNIKKAKEEYKMPEGLQKKLDDVKNTPLEEPKLFEVVEKIENQEASILEIVLTQLTEKEMDKYSMDDIYIFARAVIDKVGSLEDAKGVFKQTENTKSWQPPKPSDAIKFEQITLKKQKKANEFLSASEDKKEKAMEAFDEVAKELDEFLVSCTGVDTEKLSVWEKKLVKAQTEEAFQGAVNSFLGKR
jgi:hypothetical protein